MPKLWIHITLKLKINCASLLSGDRKGLPGNNNFKVFEAGAKSLAIKTFILAAWQLIHGTMTILLRVNKQASAFKVVNGVPNGLLVTMKSIGEATGNLEVRTNSQALKIEQQIW